MKKILFLSVVIFIFSGCKKPCRDEFNLSDSDKEWLVYEKGENLIYKNSSGVLATDIVISKAISYGVDKYSGSIGDCEKHYQQGTIEFSGDTKFKNLSIVGHQSTPNPPYIYMENYGTGKTYSYFFFISLGDTTQDQVLINGQYYDNVYIVTVEDSSQILYDNYPWKLYFNKQKGILKFEEKNGETWERNN